MKKRVVVSWSTGKDCAWALHVLRRDTGVEMAGLLTTSNAAFDRVTMHATRLAIARAQAAALGLPLQVVPLPWPCSNSAYERVMGAAVAELVERGVTHVAFGDLMLEDVRSYRTQRLAGSGVDPLFPIWGEPTDQLARRMVDSGLEAVVVCLDPKRLPRDFAGRRFDHALLDALPADVDPCGENGEFHTCVLDGPMFAHRVRATVGATVERDGFCFADLTLDPPLPRPSRA